MADDVFVHPSAVIDDGATLGPGTKVWHFCHVSGGARIGAGCTLGQNVFVAATAVLGDNVKVQNNVSIYDGVTLEDDVFCGPSMVFTNVSRPRSAFPKAGPQDFESTVVKRGATLGANSTIVCGHDVGAWAFIGAGAVVTRAVLDHALMMGNPAKRVGWMCCCGVRLPEGDGSLACGECGRTYAEAAGVLASVGAAA